MKTLSLLEAQRLTLKEAIAQTADSLRHYGVFYKHWAIAYSGGKDSTAVVTLIAHLIESGQVPAPESITVLFADTRQELPPLYNAAIATLNQLSDRGFKVRIVLPELDHRYFVYILGRGVPPPSNVFRWCTPKLKVMSMERELEAVRQESGQKLLMITGVRVGESAARDQRISVSCTKDGGECGQGWFQQSSSDAIADTLAPILHWRVCHVWDWLTFEAPLMGFETGAIAEVYGQDTEDPNVEPLAARTGCIGCPLVQEDKALERVVSLPGWSHLAPLRRLRSLYWEVHKPKYRHRQPGGETRKDGKLAAKQNRLGPLTLETRGWLRDEVLAIQAEVNRGAIANDKPPLSLINAEELARINELIAAKTYPDKWDGSEPTGDVLLPKTLSDGSIQNLLFDDSWLGA